MSSGKSYIEYRKNSSKSSRCPVCEKIGTKTHISRHIMSSYLEVGHKNFIEDQKRLLVNIYNSIEDKDFDISLIADMNDIWCSPTYIRNFFKKQFNDYSIRVSNRRSYLTKKQFADGRRSYNVSISGWKPKTKEEFGKRLLPDFKIDILKKLFYSEKTQKEVAKIVNCKTDTLFKYWINFYGKSETKARNKIAKRKAITLITEEIKQILNKLFYENKTNKEISIISGLSKSSILNYYRNNFTEDLRKQRANRLMKEGIRRSLAACGRSGATGSQPENLCCDLLKQHLNCDVIHHDYDLLPPYEIDITIPDLKIAISWNGPFHYKPIFGEKELRKSQKRDKIKKQKIIKMGWKIIEVKDCNSFDIDFVKSKVKEIIGLLTLQFEKIEI